MLLKHERYLHLKILLMGKTSDNTIYINEVSCNKYKVSINEAIDLLSISYSSNINTTVKQLLDKKLIYPEYDASYNVTRWLLTDAGKDILISIIADSKGSSRTDEQLITLCKSLQSLFPVSKKPGTASYFRGNTMEIVNKLKKYFTCFGDTYSDEEIIDATKRYVDSFHGDYRYMRLLKYFIFKKELNASGELEETSDLLTFLENKHQDGQTQQEKEDWTQTLV